MNKEFHAGDPGKDTNKFILSRLGIPFLILVLIFFTPFTGDDCEKFKQAYAFPIDLGIYDMDLCDILEDARLAAISALIAISIALLMLDIVNKKLMGKINGIDKKLDKLDKLDVISNKLDIVSNKLDKLDSIEKILKRIEEKLP